MCGEFAEEEETRKAIHERQRGENQQSGQPKNMKIYCTGAENNPNNSPAVCAQ